MMTLDQLHALDQSTLEGVKRCECGRCVAWDRYLRAPGWGVCEYHAERYGRLSMRFTEALRDVHTCPAWKARGDD